MQQKVHNHIEAAPLKTENHPEERVKDKADHRIMNKNKEEENSKN